MVADNRHYIRTLSEVILLCARQEIALRRHKESSNSDNRGNFREILTLMTAHDSMVSQRLIDCPYNAIYTLAEIYARRFSIKYLTHKGVMNQTVPKVMLIYDTNIQHNVIAK